MGTLGDGCKMQLGLYIRIEHISAEHSDQLQMHLTFEIYIAKYLSPLHKKNTTVEKIKYDRKFVVARTRAVLM
jgi:hypothetical protein